MSDDETPPKLDGSYYENEPFVSEWNSDDSPPPLDGPFIDTSMDGEGKSVQPTTTQTAAATVQPNLIMPIAKPMRSAGNPLNKKLDHTLFNGEHYNCINATQQGAGQFNAYRFVAQFEFNELEKSNFPDEELREIFQKCLARAKSGAENEMKLTPNHYIVIIDSFLLDYGITRHLKAVDEASIDEIVTHLEKVDVSNQLKGRDPVCKHPFTVDTTAVQTKGIRMQKRKLPGASKKYGCDIQYNVYQGALHAHPPFPNNYCLFYSLEWCRQKHLLTVDAFRRWKANEARQKRTVFATMNACGINKRQRFYSIFECGNMIQDYYDTQHPGIFRIFVFGTHGDFKPLYPKTNRGYFEVPLVLLYSEAEKHYEPVDHPGRLFMECGLYCFPCQRPYRKKSEHKAKCRGRCKNCQKMGTYFPCMPDNFHASCCECKKEFRNEECFERHLLKVNGRRSVCQRSKRCPDCGQTYAVKNFKEQVDGNSGGEERSVTLGPETSAEADDDEEEGMDEDDHPSFIDDDELSSLDEEEEEERILSTPTESANTLSVSEPNFEGENEEEEEMEENEVPCEEPVHGEVSSRVSAEQESMDLNAEAEEERGQNEQENIHDTGDALFDIPPMLSPIPINNNNTHGTDATAQEEVPTEGVRHSKRFTAEDYAELERVWKESEAYLKARKKEEEEKKKKYKRPDHVCGERYCKRCHQTHKKRPCFIRTWPSKPKDRRIIVYDFEATQHLKADPNLMKLIHQVNFASAHVMCYRCIDAGVWDQPLERPCEICGEHRTYTWASFDYQGSDHHVHTVVENDEAVLPLFTDWLLHFEQRNTSHLQVPAAKNTNTTTKSKQQKGRQPRTKTYETICYAHNGSRYDHIFVFGEIVRAGGLRPTLIRQGNTLLQMKVSKPRIITTTTFRDTLKIIPIGLAKFVKTFGLQIPNVEGKQYFPYKFNIPLNYHKQMNRLPQKTFYSPGHMFPKEREEFLRWYEQNKNMPFCLKDVLADYCNSDVKILAHGLVKMRALFKELTEREITESITLPSALMKYFVSTFPTHQAEPGYRPVDLKVALTPYLGYDPQDKQSALARNYIKYWAAKHQQQVQFCESKEGEYDFNGYKIDGFVRRPPPERNLAIEIFGCYWHGCRRCYPQDDATIANGETAWAIRKRDAQRIAAMKKEMEVKVKWECDIRRRLKYKEEMKKFFDECFDTGPINVHDAFFGGRTNCERILAQPHLQNQGKGPGDVGHRTVKYKDFVSLYPYVNFSCPYPITHPETKVYNAYNGVDVNWTDPEHIECPETKKEIKGIVKCFVVPPLSVPNDIPAMPLRENNRLLFPLCKTCAQSFTEGLTDRTYSCEHREDLERGFVATTATPELKMALSVGYRVTKLIRWWNWPDDKDDWSDSLFKPYIRKFMKIKYEASGWPDECLEQGISEEERERRKQRVIDMAFVETGIVLDPENMVFNPGLRYVAKLCLNSLWGRFALRNRLSKSALALDVGELAEYLDDDRIEITGMDQMTEQCWLLTYKDKEMEVAENYASNPIIALYTTAYARCHLLKHLWMLNEDGRKDARILYMDTDSVIYEYETRLGDPLPEGSKIGQLKDEYPTMEIADYFALGPKSYMMLLRDPLTDKESVIKKCKGIVLNFEADARLHYERVREMVINAGRFPRDYNMEEVENRERNFRITPQGNILTVPMVKKVCPTYFKGVLRGVRIVPFGYVHNSH